jgi:hypothetical protein
VLTRQVPREDSRARRATTARRFYVIYALMGPQFSFSSFSLFLFWLSDLSVLPGSAEGQPKDHPGGRVVGIETSDKMTDPQIVAKVSGRYLDEEATPSSN